MSKNSEIHSKMYCANVFNELIEILDNINQFRRFVLLNAYTPQ